MGAIALRSFRAGLRRDAPLPVGVDELNYGRCMSRIPGSPPARSQDRQQYSHEQQRRYVTEQVSMIFRRLESLNSHDGGMHETRPDGEPDETEMFERVARRLDKEHAEGRVNADDH